MIILPILIFSVGENQGLMFPALLATMIFLVNIIRGLKYLPYIES